MEQEILNRKLDLHKLWLDLHKLWVESEGKEGERADLSGAILPDSLKFTPDPDLLKKVAETVLSAPMCLNMDSWHSDCGTTHCLAGWAVTIHPDGKRLEDNSSTYLAGRLLLGDKAAEHFFDSNENVIEWLKSITTKQQTPDWANAPKWAQWFAIDGDGEGYWYKEKPIKNKFQWCHGGNAEFIDNFNTSNWEESLQQRPTQRPALITTQLSDLF